GVFSESLNHVMHSLYPHTSDSLMDVADRLAPSIKDSHNKTLREMVEITKHIVTHGSAPGLAGAAAGAGLGALTGKKDEKLKGAGKGALVGGALGFGSGALNDAYNLGDNSRNQVIDSYKQEQDDEKSNTHWFKKPDDSNNDRINKNIDTLK
ncbi:hypothetical protein, partial [Staphylococcus aureus]|uniref:hypothetical protein n=1 Tax=Staphylococcus aureus TaxID=1280 RepID=UPI0039BECB38